MRFPNDAPVTPAKREALRARIAELGIELGHIEEIAVRSRGPGGQNVNKRNTGVQLLYEEAGKKLVVKAMRERSFGLNRFLALRQLTEEIARLRSPGDRNSPGRREADRIAKNRARAKRRRAAREKEHNIAHAQGTDDTAENAKKETE